MKYRVVKITNNLEDYDECKEDTEDFPELVKYVDDEMSIFVVDENRNFWPAGEFFYIESIKEFEVIT